LGVATVREADGLAMSSRNQYLSAQERTQAASLNRAMRSAISRIAGGAPVGETLVWLKAEILAGGFASVDYADLRDAETMAELGALNGRPARLLVAARIGAARLIDNMAMDQH